MHDIRSSTTRSTSACACTYGTGRAGRRPRCARARTRTASWGGHTHGSHNSYWNASTDLIWWADALIQGRGLGFGVGQPAGWAGTPADGRRPARRAPAWPCVSVMDHWIKRALRVLDRRQRSRHPPTGSGSPPCGRRTRDPSRAERCACVRAQRLLRRPARAPAQPCPVRFGWIDL